MIVNSRLIWRSKPALAVAAVAFFTIAGCEQIENEIARRTEAEGRTHIVTLVELLATGKKYDGLEVGVGGYVGPYYFGPAPAIYFVPDHITAGDSTLGIWIVDLQEDLIFDNLCDHVGSYILAFGKYDHNSRKLTANKITRLQEPKERMDKAECQGLTDT